MKKLYTLFAIAFLAVSISASGQNVILRFSNNYEVNIDGRFYASNETVPVLNYGQHHAKLYEVQPGFLGIGKKRTLLNSANFEFRNNDIIIEVDRNNKLRITETGKNNTQQNRDDRNYDKDNDDNRNKNGRGYGPYDNPGRGNKYGLYKNKQHKHDDKDKKEKKDKKNKDDKDDKRDSQYNKTRYENRNNQNN